MIVARYCATHLDPCQKCFDLTKLHRPVHAQITMQGRYFMSAKATTFIVKSNYYLSVQVTNQISLDLFIKSRVLQY